MDSSIQFLRGLFFLALLDITLLLIAPKKEDAEPLATTTSTLCMKACNTTVERVTPKVK